jgi:hypothetical protein
MAYRTIPDDAPNRDVLIDRKYERFNRINDFFKDAPPLFRPYIGLQHRIEPNIWAA